MQLDDYKEGIKLYNPQSTSAQMLKNNFVIRLHEYRKLWRAIEQADMTNPEQHFIVQGVRGAGKTTLLSRLALAVEEDENLSKWLIPVVFKEEEYGITSLFTLWERVAEELDNHSNTYSGLLDDIDALEETDPKQAVNLLNSYLRKNHNKIILFIDNLVELFQNFNTREEETLREVLITNNNIRLIGGSAVSLEAFYDNKAPFYQFFNIITLKGLKSKDTIALLKKLSEHGGPEEQQKLDNLLKNEPGRIESIRRLTGGIPRTLVILFHILMDGPKGSTFKLLEETVDQTTPLYKHRMDDLAKQHRPIVNAIALNWDAMSAKEIAEKTRIPSKQISAQLGQLEKQWIIEKIPTSTKNNLYALKERFFNIWYLMRYGRRRDKKKVIWLTRFFEVWCSGDELKLRSQSFIQQLDHRAHPKAALTFANALMCSDLLGHGDKKQVFDSTAEFLEKSGNKKLMRELFDVEVTDGESGNEADGLYKQWSDDPRLFLVKLKERLVVVLKDSKEPLKSVLSLLKDENNNSLSVTRDLLQHTDTYNKNLLLGCIYYDLGLYQDAKPFLNDALNNNELLVSQLLGDIYYDLGNYSQSEINYLRAIELNAQGCHSLLAKTYIQIEKYQQAEKYARQAVEYKESFANYMLAASLYYQEKFDDALNSSLISLEIDGEQPYINHIMGHIFNIRRDVEKTEIYLLKALALDSEYQSANEVLAELYSSQERYLEAKACFEKLKNLEKFDDYASLAKVYIKLADIEATEITVRNAQAAGHIQIFNEVSWYCFEDNIYKEHALKYSTKAQTLKQNIDSLHTHTAILLWNNKFEAATTSMNQFLTDHITELEEREADFIQLFTLFLAKGQTNLVDTWLKQYQLTERLKPLYYALMSLMRDKYPNEILRMGAELKETVDEILQRIEQWAEDYK